MGLFLVLGFYFGIAEARPDAFAVNGIPLGVTEEEAASMLGENFKCGTTNHMHLNERLLSTRFCTVKAPSARWQSNDDTFAGMSTTIYYWILDGRVHHVSFSSLRPKDFDQAVSILSKMFGNPARSSIGFIGDGIGGEFENMRAKWMSSRGDVILYDKFGLNLDISNLDFYSPAGWARRNLNQESKQQHTK